MSARSTEFLTNPSQTIEEAWDLPEPEETRRDDLRSHKKYRLVFNGRADSIRLEAPPLDTAIIEAIELSRHILSLEEDWDEEGSPGYQQATWERATNFIKELAISYWELTNLWVCPPRIMPGPEGSIDIHWNASNRELLINVPTDEESPAGYFGSSGPKDTIKGKLETSSQNQWILMWLLR